MDQNDPLIQALAMIRGNTPSLDQSAQTLMSNPYTAGMGVGLKMDDMQNNIAMQRQFNQMILQNAMQQKMMQSARDMAANDNYGVIPKMGYSQKNGVEMTWDPLAQAQASFNTGVVPMPGGIRNQSQNPGPSQNPNIPSQPQIQTPTQASGGFMSPKDMSEANRIIKTNRNQQDYESLQKLQQDLIDKANSSRQALNITAQMRDLMQNFTPGKFADTKATFSAYAQGLGLPVAAKQMQAASSVQEFGKLTAQLVSQQVKETSNRMLQSEFNVFLKNNPNPTLTPQALNELLNFMDRASTYNINGLHDFTQFRKSNTNATAADFADWNNQRILSDINAHRQAQPSLQMDRSALIAEARRRGLMK